MNDMILFNIQRFSTHDGPGIRTTVFFKGCPLKCRWCHNPESQSFKPEIMNNSERCVLCGKCVMVCPVGAPTIIGDRVKVDTNKCVGCRVCVEECLNCAMELAGEHRTVSSVMDVIRRDKTFYGESGGGVTFSGGECLSRPEPLLELLKACRRGGIHTAVDTCGYAPWETLESTMPYTNLYLYDIKCMDREKHLSLTGADNEIILNNLYRLKDGGGEIWLRLPLIDKVNSSEEDILPVLALAEEIRPRRISLLPYHNTGNFKYTRLGREPEEFAPPPEETVNEIKRLFEEKGFDVKIGG